jgi:hypothetical protein
MAHKDFVITTKLEGFISLKPSGKFNNCRIGFTLTDKEFEEFEAEYEAAVASETAALLAKTPGARVGQDPQPWGEDGCIKYSYGNPDPGPEDSKKPDFLWVHGPDNLPFDLETPVRSGSIVQLAVRLIPYTFGKKVGLSLRVRAGKIIKAVSVGEAPPPVSSKEAADIFGSTPLSEGYEDDDDDVPF